MPSILFVDDDRDMRELVRDALGRLDFTVETIGSADEAYRLLGERDFDVLVTDLNMDGMSGLELCRRVVATRPDIPVILVTAFGNMEAAIAAIRAGVHDFINKPMQMDELALAVHRAVRLRTMREGVKKLRDETSPPPTFDDAVGASESVRRVYDLIDRLGDSDATVLITGESGTGKELVARALHRRSSRNAKPFVAINCAALPEAILESELFGHVRGAFTDAKESKSGLFVEAHGGTLFLDEIGDMPLGMQVKLLRALQERTVRQVGGQKEMPFDARILVATNRDLEQDVAEHRFREDLYYRINVVHLDLPPLRNRGHDVLLIAQHFLLRYAKRSRKEVLGFSAAAAEKLLAYEWPGNVRELQNCVERAVALTKFDQIMVEDLPPKIAEHPPAGDVTAGEPGSGVALGGEVLTLDQVERRHILDVLRSVSGNKSLAAKLLKLDRRTLYRKLEQFEKDAAAASPK